MRMSVAEFVRPMLPTVGPPFVPSKIIRVGLFSCVKLSRETAKHEATVAAPIRNCLRFAIEVTSVSLLLATAMDYRAASTNHKHRLVHHLFRCRESLRRASIAN